MPTESLYLVNLFPLVKLLLVRFSVNNLTGIETRIDTTNQILTDLSVSNVSTSTAPNIEKSKSYWVSKYPSGLSGVWSEFVGISKIPLCLIG